MGVNAPSTSGACPPTWLVHGSQDTLVPLGDSKWAREALQAAGVEVTLVTVPGVDHGFDSAFELADGHFLAEGDWLERILLQRD